MTPKVATIGNPAQREGVIVVPQPVDQQKANQFARKLVDIYAGCVLTQLVDVGYETGLFEAAARGPGTS